MELTRSVFACRFASSMKRSLIPASLQSLTRHQLLKPRNLLRGFFYVCSYNRLHKDLYRVCVSKFRTTIKSLANTLCSIEPLLLELDEEAKSAKPELQEIIDAAYFKPGQDERIKFWFVKFLTMRENLWQIIDEAYELAGVSIGGIKTKDEFRLFILGFVAACQVVRLDRLLLERVATHTFIQRKLNEGIPEHNVQRKQYTAICEAFTEPGKAFKVFQAIKVLDKQPTKIAEFKDDEDLDYFVNNIHTYRGYLDESKKNYFRRSFYFLRHALRRRGARIKQQTQFKFLEA